VVSSQAPLVGPLQHDHAELFQQARTLGRYAVRTLGALPVFFTRNERILAIGCKKSQG
jgi:hypothetical protein